MLSRSDLREALRSGDAAGRAAVDALQVRPMVVFEADLLSGERRPGGQSWYVPDGVCGFAWVNVYGVRGNARKWFEELGFSQSNYDRCLKFWVSDFNQSMQKKEVYAEKVAEALRSLGLKASSGSRMD